MQEFLCDYFIQAAIGPAVYLTLRRWAGSVVLVEALFDANLSPKLARRLKELFPGSTHIFEAGLARSTSDEKIREFARVNNFTIVTADSDFVELSRGRGAPRRSFNSKIDYRTARVEELLRRHAVLIAESEQSERRMLVIRK